VLAVIIADRMSNSSLSYIEINCRGHAPLTSGLLHPQSHAG
jgi:hypothetical protein